MESCRHVDVPLRNGQGTLVGSLHIALLPGTVEREATPALLDRTLDTSRDSDEPAIQLLEGFEYRYEVRLEGLRDELLTDRPEVFQPDSLPGISGRVRTGSYTGTLPLRFTNKQGREIG